MRLSAFLLLIFIVLSIVLKPALAVQKSYIVYLGPSASEIGHFAVDSEAVTTSHYDLLSSFLQSNAKADDAILYSYNKVFNGFTAILHEEEARQLQKHPKVISVFENQLKKLHTTRSWEFLLGLKHNEVIPNYSIWKKANFGEDIIIANLDTGVWPESKSFTDENMGSIPKKFKGACENENDPTFRCNRKLIGARYFDKGYAESLRKYNLTYNYTKSPRDTQGHGSHTLSTAGGNLVKGANIKGFGNGTAVGGSPRARIATYKVCWPGVGEQFEGGCSDSDILAGLEAAIVDGVDVISMSVGGPQVDYLKDSIALGSFHAVGHGIPVITSAGNEGPDIGSVTNVAPWLFTVAASTTDRQFLSYVSLPNHHTIKGASCTQKGLKKLYPLISAANAGFVKTNANTTELCMDKTINPKKAKGKILVCQGGFVSEEQKGYEAARVGAVGMILTNTQDYGLQIIDAFDFPIPSSHLNSSESKLLFEYLKSSKSPVASITGGKTKFGFKPAPYVASFSSRGPNPISPDVFKPDIIAPGVRIIAAYSEARELKQEGIPYNILDGTSMACPHITGIVGLLKSIYPHWSPSAIKSAIMTTASTRDNRRKPIVNSRNIKATPLEYGSGHVRPNRAMDPGLVYDMNLNDYLNFLCAIGYTKDMIKIFSKQSYDCPSLMDAANINYPIITISSFSGNATVVRRVKNVGQPGTYDAHVKAPANVAITVEPKTLVFAENGQELEYKLVFRAKTGHRLSYGYSYGYIMWSDGKHHVRSTIAIRPDTTKHQMHYQLL